MTHVNEDLAKVTRHLATHAKHVAAAIAQKNSSLNIISETILKPVFQVAFDLPNLENLNELQANYPAIDLADGEKRVCIQITSTNKADKVKKTIKKFVENKLYQKYDRLMFYILTEKQKSYPAKAITAEVQGTFTFDPKKDILDYTDLSAQIGTLQVDKIRLLLDILEANFNGGKFPVSSLDSDKFKESLFLNWMAIKIPKQIFSAVTTVDLHALKSHLRTNTQAPVLDWVVYEGKIFTFRDLNEQGEVLGSSSVIDQGTIEEYDSSDFFQIDENYQKVFKNLLRRALEQQLHSAHIAWQHQSQVFIFMPLERGDDERKEAWLGKKNSTRTVYKHTHKSNKPTETLNHRHFAFDVDFVELGSEWYMTIKPDIFISRDGYYKDDYGSTSIKIIKGRERNSHIFNHTRFIAFMLKKQNPSILSPSYPPGIEFGDLVEFTGVPKFNETDWKSRDDTPPVKDEELDVLSEQI